MKKDEVDPLDAFMAGIDAQVKEEKTKKKVNPLNIRGKKKKKKKKKKTDRGEGRN